MLRKISKFLIFLALFFSFSLFGWEVESENVFNFNEKPPKFFVLEKNTLSPLPSLPKSPPLVIVGIVTAYSSTPWETDETPFLTASQTLVRDGVVANNYFPFGTKIKIPEIFGDKVFVVEDRMAPRKWKYHFDVWFENYFEALNFGSKITKIEILDE
ncbi:3D domain-containing protein [Candidatus Parcubacteria bacterium]|nr:3D domain-containing protein [Candidatus Parcubacteria bacterium]